MGRAAARGPRRLRRERDANRIAVPEPPARSPRCGLRVRAVAGARAGRAGRPLRRQRPRLRMILVTLGTLHFPFDRLLRALGALPGDEELVVQTRAPGAESLQAGAPPPAPPAPPGPAPDDT